MGGITRIIKKLPGLKQVIAPAPAPAPAPTPAPTTPVEKPMAQPKPTFGGGLASSTILTSARGIEEDASVSKTVLGGASKKKQKNNRGY